MWNSDSPIAGHKPGAVPHLTTSATTTGWSCSTYIRPIENAMGRKATLNLLPMQPGDVAATAADTSLLSAAVGFKPGTPVEEGVRRFVEWYCDYYKVVR